MFSSVEEAAEMIEIGKAYEPAGTDYTECYERYKSYDAILNV